MTDSKRAFYFVVGVFGFLAYGYVRYASAWLPAAPQGQSVWERAQRVIERVVSEVESGIENDDSETVPLGPGGSTDIPDATVAYAIAARPVATLIASVMADNFTPLYSVISNRWKESASVESLRETYGDLVDVHPDFQGLSKLTITETPKMVNDEELLVRGRAVSGTETISFDLWLVQEEGEWLASDLAVTLER